MYVLSIVIPGNSDLCSSRKKTSFRLAASFTVTGVTRSPLMLLDLRCDVGERNAEDPRQPSELGILDVRGRDPHGGCARVFDQHPAVTVLHGAARSLLRVQSELVVLRRNEELVAREHLERPEANEEDGERGEHEEAEDPDPEEELRREPVGSVDRRVPRQEAPGSNRDRSASQRTPPPAAAAPA